MEIVAPFVHPPNGTLNLILFGTRSTLCLPFIPYDLYKNIHNMNCRLVEWYEHERPVAILGDRLFLQVACSTYVMGHEV